MKKLYLLGLLCLAIAACSKKHTPSGSARHSNSNERPHPQSSRYPSNIYLSTKGYKKAMVVNFSGRDGCDFALQMEDGENIEPDELPREFQHNNLNVWVKYTIRHDAESICMIGKMIHISDIQKR